MRTTSPLHAVTWSLWALAAAASVQLAPSPLYVALVIAVAFLVVTAHRIDSGWVQVNQGGGQQVGQSYGGMKQSGVGREFSLEGMLEGFTQVKQINVRL